MRRRDFLGLACGATVLMGLPCGCATARSRRGVRMEGLAMASFATTLMGVVKGALDYYHVDASAPVVFGASGHAFLINVHEELCPSGPYCWNRDVSNGLIRNLGVNMTDLGFFSPQQSAAERAAVEAKLRDALDQGIPCSLLNLENQMITGYDSDGFFTAQPWAPEFDFPPARLSFGSWKELGNTFHASFYVLKRCEPASARKAVLDSLDYAVDLHANPEKYSLNGYGIGPRAYENWIKAAPKFGATHGNWLNATVWSECRRMASAYFAHIRSAYPETASDASKLVKDYADMADALGLVSDKSTEAAERINLLRETQAKESEAIASIAALAVSLRAGAES